MKDHSVLSAKFEKIQKNYTKTQKKEKILSFITWNGVFLQCREYLEWCNFKRKKIISPSKYFCRKIYGILSTCHL